MAEPIATEYVKIAPDTKGFKSDVERDINPVVKSLKDNLAALTVGAAAGIGLKSLTDSAAELQQTVGGTTAVFGEFEDTVVAFAKSADESAGLSEQSARRATSAIGGLLKGFGFTKKEAAETSVELAQLGADLAATFGGTSEDAVMALGAALRGEMDPLERFGISLNQTAVNLKAVELGLADSTENVSQNAKAQAALALITERSADAQGQFARESDTAAGAAQISAAKTKNAADDLSSAFLPIYTKIAELVGTVADGFAALPGPVQTGVVALAAAAIAVKPLQAGFRIAQDVTRLLGQAVDRAAGSLYSGAGALDRYGGSAARLATSAAGIVGVALALKQLADASSEGKFGSTDLDRTQTAIQHLADTGEFSGAIGNINDLKDAIDRASDSDRNAQFGNGIGEFLNSLVGGSGDEAEKKIQAVDEALANLAKSDPSAAAKAYQSLLDGLGISAEQGASTFDDYAGAVEDLGLAQKDAGADADSLDKKLKGQALTLDEAYQAATDLIGAQKDQRDAARGVADAQDDIADAQKDAVQASRDIRSAQLDLIDAERDLQEIQRRGAADQRDIAGSQLDARQARLDLADAQRELNETLADPKASAEDKERAQIALERAQLRVADSTDAVSEAQRKAAERGTELERAQQRVQDARDGIVSAQEAQRDSVTKLADANNKLSEAYLTQALAAVALEQVQDTIAGNQTSATEKTDILRGSLEKMQATLDPSNPLYQNLQQFIDALNAIPITAAHQLIQEKARPGLINAERASGGPVDGVAQVAEGGRPEIFEDRNGRTFLVGQGYVTPAARTGGLSSSTPSAQPATVHVVNNIYGSDPRVTAEKATAAAKRATFLHGVST